MENLDWQLIVVLVCVAFAAWSLITRFRNLMAGKGGCGDCSNARPSTNDTGEPDLVSEEQIEILYKTEK